MYEARIVRHNIVKIPGPLQCADDRIVSAFQDSNHTPFAPAFNAVRGRIAQYTRNYAIAMHCCSDILSGDKNVRLARFFRHEKAVPSLMNRQFTGYEVCFSRKNVSVLADARDLACSLELTQCFP
jgi:hypothetical protein